jgi:hypothetical protein
VLTVDTAATKVGLRSTAGTAEFGFVRCTPVGTPPAPTLNKNAGATASNVPLAFAELVAA